MKKCIFIFLVIVSALLKAQTFSVGNTSCNYSLVNKTFTTATSSTTAYSNFDNCYMDLDGDLAVDINIRSYYAHQPPTSGFAFLSISATSTTGVEFVYTPVITGYYNQVIANVSFGTLLSPSLNWKLTPPTPSVNSAAPVVYESYYKYSPTFSYTSGSQTNPFYIGFRKILPGNDTIYGWIKMNSNLPGTVYDYAYKQVSNITSPPTSTFVTASTGICIGDSITLNANPNGGMFSGSGVFGNKFKSETLSTGAYNVYYTVPNPGGCTVSSMLTLTVNPLPTISLFNWFYSLCINDTLEINPYPIGAPFVYSGNGLVGNTFYAASAGMGLNTVSISLTDSNGCTRTSEVNINISSCVGIKEFGSSENHFQIFPNPNNGEFEIKGIREEEIFISNELGQLISIKFLSKENNYSIKTNDLQSGVYFVGNKISRQKIVVIK